MNRVVLDASITIGSCVGEQEAAEFADGVMDLLMAGVAVVPGIWLGEVANALISKERTSKREYRLAPEEVTRFLAFVGKLPVIVDWTTQDVVFHAVAELARSTGLTVYDAYYLELAKRLELPLGTLDEELGARACEAGVRLLTKDLFGKLD